jgi:hypothetical protein
MARRRGNRNRLTPRDEAADQEQVRALLARLAEVLRDIDHPRAAEVAALRESFATDPAAAWRALDGNAWWAGAGSLAAEALLPVERLPARLTPAERAAAPQALRALLIELAELLRARGPTNPGLSSWLLAFRNWEASGV